MDKRLLIGNDKYPIKATIRFTILKILIMSIYDYSVHNLSILEDICDEYFNFGLC